MTVAGASEVEVTDVSDRNNGGMSVTVYSPCV